MAEEVNEVKPKQPKTDESPALKSFEALPSPSRINNKSKTPPKKDDRVKYPDFSKIPDAQKLVRLIVILLVIAIFGFGSGWLGSYLENKSGNNQLSTTQAKEIVTSQGELTAAIAGDVSPSVVSIEATSTSETTDIFGDVTPTTQQDEGTGIIITSSGYVITNRHVIPAGTTSVSITLADGTTINNVQMVGTTAANDSLDIGFLKINNAPEPLQPAILGDSSKVQVGDEVVAIGNALGQFQNTVTSGIISGRGRTIQAGDSTGTESEDLQDLFQTDAAINEGNSGGPLINENGEVIGINTALASNGAQNIGFTIPINDAEGLIKGILSTGKVERPYIGVYYETITPSIEKQNNLTVSQGAYIPQSNNGQASIVAGSPADQAGLKPGDVITAVNSTSVNASNSLSELIDENQVGNSISLTVIRGGNTMTLNATIGQDPNN